MALVFIIIPLIDTKNQDAGYMSRIIENKKYFVPRIGEHIFIDVNTSLKVEKIEYSGYELMWVSVKLEPLSSEYRVRLEGMFKSRRQNSWSWNQNRITDQ